MGSAWAGQASAKARAATSPDDRRVLAAAVNGGASLIDTFNLTDYPESVLTQHHVEAVQPEEFVVRLRDESPESVLEAARRQRAGLKRPPKTAADD